jgi:hypothetical protein
VNASGSQGLVALVFVAIMFLTGPALLVRWAVKRRHFIDPDDRPQEWRFLVVGVLLTLVDVLLLHQLATTIS